MLFSYYLLMCIADSQFMIRFMPDPHNLVRCEKVIQGWYYAGKVDDDTYEDFQKISGMARLLYV